MKEKKYIVAFLDGTDGTLIVREFVVTKDFADIYEMVEDSEYMTNSTQWSVITRLDIQCPMKLVGQK